MATNAVAAAQPGDRPAWLWVLPESVQQQLVAQIQAQPKNVQEQLARAAAYLTPEHMAACETVEDAIEMLKAMAEAVATDDQVKYIPPVYTIDHRTQRFRDDGGNTLNGPLRGVILHFQPTRGFFIEGRKLPLCSSIGDVVNGTAQKDAQEAWSQYKLYNPQVPITWAGGTNTCANCYFNEFGSDPKTGAGKACKEKYRLFLALVDAQGNLTGEGVLLNVPTTSMRSWDTYVNSLKRHKDEKGRPAPLTTLHVVTEFGLEKAQGQGQDYAKVQAKVAGILAPQQFMQVYQLRKQIVEVAKQLGVEIGESYDETVDQGAGGPPGDFNPDDDVV